MTDSMTDPKQAEDRAREIADQIPDEGAQSGSSQIRPQPNREQISTEREIEQGDTTTKTETTTEVDRSEDGN
jgi:hypothetical protein